jgi:shikimate dehydrogenase
MEGVGANWDDLSFLNGLPKTAVVCDLIYKPEKTMLLTVAESLGLKTQSGLAMLIYQALIAEEHFLGFPINRAEMAGQIKANLTTN